MMLSVALAALALARPAFSRSEDARAGPGPPPGRGPWGEKEGGPLVLLICGSKGNSNKLTLIKINIIILKHMGRL